MSRPIVATFRFPRQITPHIAAEYTALRKAFEIIDDIDSCRCWDFSNPFEATVYMNSRAHQTLFHAMMYIARELDNLATERWVN